jgi:hypothetical protein
MNPSESRIIIYYGEKIFNTIERISRKGTPNVTMQQIKSFIRNKMSQCNKSKALLETEWLTRKDNLCCLAKGQIVQHLLESTDMLESN